MSCAKSSIEYMSWCGGGDMRVTPASRGRTRAMVSSTLCPAAGRPRLASRRAIFICNSRAFARYSGRHAEPAARDLLDCARLVVVRADSLVARGVLAALSAVAHTAEPVHGKRNRLVRLRAYGTETHRARDEPAHDGVDALDLLYRNRLCGLELEQPAQSAQVARLVIYVCRVFAVLGDVVFAHGALQERYRLRSPEMVLAVLSVLVLAGVFEGVFKIGLRVVRAAVAFERLPRDFREPYAAHARRRRRKIGVHELLSEPHGLEHLRLPVAAQG